MDVTSGRTMSFPTSKGTAHVWQVDNSNPHGMAGWLFMLPGENGTQHYFSEHGRIFLRISFHEPNWLPEFEDTDPEKVKLLRELWVKAVDRGFAQQNTF